MTLMKYPKSKILLFTVLGLCFGSLSAQTEIKGKVVDFMTYLPIESASVYVQNSTIGTISNVDGKFQLSIPREYQNDTAHRRSPLLRLVRLWAIIANWLT